MGGFCFNTDTVIESQSGSGDSGQSHFERSNPNENVEIEVDPFDYFCLTPEDDREGEARQNSQMECGTSENDVILQEEEVPDVYVNITETETELRFFSKDPADWNPLDDDLVSYITSNPPIQVLPFDFSKSVRKYEEGNRRLTAAMFQKQLHNKELKKRDWLLYSEKKASVYCVPCKLFSKIETDFNSDSGFNDWKNCTRIEIHESTAHHRNAVLDFVARRKEDGRIDTQFEKEVCSQQAYWCNVLQRIVSTVKFLSSRGLAFRGSDEKFGSPHNGNFLRSLEFLSEFDPFIKEHIIKFGNKGKGYVSYLSANITEQFISLMSQKVENNITEDIKLAKYFGIVVDSTPDISRTDQLSFIFRYVCPKSLQPVERFLTFIPMYGHTAGAMENLVLEFIKKCGLDIKNCRGQSYDNASNMSGQYSGLQARIKSSCKYAAFVPCVGHSLNLVGACAAESCVTAVSFFGLVQKVYTFFSASTHRWAILKKTPEE